LIASLDGAVVAAIGPPQADAPAEWNTYVAVDDADVAAAGFNAPLFGWEFDDIGFATMIRRPGYGDHLAATVDPGIHERQEGISAPPGFADAIGWLAPLENGHDHRHVTFTVASRDESAATAERLGAVVISSDDTEWTKTALIRDPQGAELTLSQFTPPGG
jgi:hypothetical protein